MHKLIFVTLLTTASAIIGTYSSISTLSHSVSNKLPSRASVLSKPITITPKLTEPVHSLPTTAVSSLNIDYSQANEVITQKPPSTNTPPANMPNDTSKSITPDSSSAPLLTREPSPIACTNSWPNQSCIYEQPPTTPKRITMTDPIPIACTNSWPNPSCYFGETTN